MSPVAPRRVRRSARLLRPAAAAPSPGRRRRTAPPRRARRRGGAARSMSVSAIRAPDAPSGWPTAIAPPFTFTMSGLTPSSRMEATPTAANASLISMRSRSPTARPALPSAFLIAFDGWECRLLSGPATVPNAPTSARTVAPELGGLRPAGHDDRGGAVGDLRGRARGDRAVRAEGGPAASPATPAVVSPRMPSSAAKTIVSFRDLTSTGTISSASRPSLAARAARCCERAANSSCSRAGDAQPARCAARWTRPSTGRRTRRSGRPRAIESSSSTAPYL